MDTATIRDNGERQTIELPVGMKLPSVVMTVRMEGEKLVLEPLKETSWPEGYFESFHITDPEFGRLDQPIMPLAKSLGEE